MSDGPPSLAKSGPMPDAAQPARPIDLPPGRRHPRGSETGGRPLRSTETLAQLVDRPWGRPRLGAIVRDARARGQGRAGRGGPAPRRAARRARHRARHRGLVQAVPVALKLGAEPYRLEVAGRVFAVVELLAFVEAACSVSPRLVRIGRQQMPRECRGARGSP